MMPRIKAQTIDSMKKQKKDFIDKKKYRDSIGFFGTENQYLVSGNINSNEEKDDNNNENYLGSSSIMKDAPDKSLSELEKEYYKAFRPGNSN